MLLINISKLQQQVPLHELVFEARATPRRLFVCAQSSAALVDESSLAVIAMLQQPRVPMNYIPVVERNYLIQRRPAGRADELIRHQPAKIVGHHKVPAC